MLLSLRCFGVLPRPETSLAAGQGAGCCSWASTGHSAPADSAPQFVQPAQVLLDQLQR